MRNMADEECMINIVYLSTTKHKDD